MHRRVECYRKDFGSNAMPDRRAWTRDTESVSYFVVNGRNGNVALPLHFGNEKCFPLSLINNNTLLAVVYPEPSNNSLFQRDSVQLPKALLVQYDFGAKDLDRLRTISSPFLDRTPAEVLSSREGPAAPQSQVEFFIDLEEPEKKTSIKEVRYRCYAPDGTYSGERKVGFRQPVSIIEPKVSNGSKYQIELDAGAAFETLKVDVPLKPGEITELGRLKLKPAVTGNRPIKIFGTVNNAEGEALVGVEVIANDKIKTLTDHDGKFQIVGIDGRNNWLYARLNGYLEHEEFVAVGDTSRLEFKKSIVLSKCKRIMLRYAFSEHRSYEFIKDKGETATIEVRVDSDSCSLKNISGLSKQFAEFAIRNRLSIETVEGVARLKGRTAIWTSDQNDFDLITEVGTLAKDQRQNDQRLSVGKTLIVRGFDLSRKENRLDYCVKILVESIE